ncbi:MAG: SsrA-binding protein SmpB [Candidatus Wildermuthbacteria bacterium]|nr:SsrA-binding protein SmpB [Candidatus Wildermuthbacteria bacterium]MBI2121249.1 SsrA-binding protein SmpB [Candidatus Wildermuthbacteria bacterium]MBI2647859.1 SsrA-binding protein SmpB [Candidatus Wildermuthbacteria bacterium]
MKVLSEHRKARFDYEILETLQAGLALQGQEVKSIKLGRVRLEGSYVVPKGEEMLWIGAVIPPYQPQNAPSNYNPERSRQILLTRKELSSLLGRAKERGLTLIPLKLYTAGRGMIKLEIGVAKGKKLHDKRETIREREAQREMGRFVRG